MYGYYSHNYKITIGHRSSRDIMYFFLNSINNIKINIKNFNVMNCCAFQSSFKLRFAKSFCVSSGQLIYFLIRFGGKL